MANIVKFGGGAGGVNLNIAYGLTPPADKTKLWVPLAKKPDFVEVSGDSLQTATDAVAVSGATITASGTISLLGCSSAEVDGKIYVFFNGVDYVYIYDPETDTVTTKDVTHPLSSTTYKFPAVAINGKIYVFYKDEDGSKTYEYNPEANEFTDMGASLSYRTVDASAVAINGKAYIFGGRSDTGHSYIQEYDPESNTVSVKTAVLAADNYDSSAVAINGKAYIFGGTASGSGRNTIQEYDPISDTIETKAATLSRISIESCAVTLNGKAYVFGGRTTELGSNAGNIYADIHEYDPVTDICVVKDTSFSQGFNKATAHVVGDTAYIFGPRDTTTKVMTIQLYTPKAYLSTNHLKLFASVYSEYANQIITKIVNSKKAQIKLCFNSAFIGDADGYAMAQPAYVYNEDAAVWQTLDGNNRAGGVSLLGDATLGDMVLGNGG